jgi:hypothetical protein
MKTILHLCADIGSDSRHYQLDPAYEVIKIGKNIGVENYHADRPIHGIIANPVCTEFSVAKGHGKGNHKAGMVLVTECLRIINQAQPVWWVLENPATGTLGLVWKKPRYTYEPWQYGDPWTKKTGLWGKFTMPKPLYTAWEQVPKNPGLYIRPGRKKPGLAFLHKSAMTHVPAWHWALDMVKTDMDFRSMCPDGFARAFKEANP